MGPLVSELRALVVCCQHQPGLAAGEPEAAVRHGQGTGREPQQGAETPEVAVSLRKVSSSLVLLVQVW